MRKGRRSAESTLAESENGFSIGGGKKMRSGGVGGGGWKGASNPDDEGDGIFRLPNKEGGRERVRERGREEL